ncbi:GDP-mannose 4,6-dehydratase [Phototrophicus methaneseepsis]|uniref:GDP-mannose 4,6-dehydratase n=1 Tax=Phototrophicus methaneseepsis TaxID=2710758 RepID=A0A7S8ICV7_9CHLR|nr:GDP-mannose 4,6-dehydratase [Phototrophicus methaneseepsis]QPC80881.1 GDP-mannose 4,6-dehydratase [Phototrophicus methaneseepsis]
MRVLITGATGFVGQHLSTYLKQVDPDVVLHGTSYNVSDIPPADGIQYHQVDLRQADVVQELINTVQPDEIYHLAAMASSAASFKEPWPTLEANIHIQLNLLEACRTLPASPRIVVSSSATIYGPTTPEEQPLDEAADFRPTNTYSLSKITQDMMGLQYFLMYQMPIIRARAFNHLGPGQGETFVAPDFALQIARIEANQQAPIMKVGNLSAARDFTDVRDVAKAYVALMKKGQAGTAYNIASNNAYSIQHLLDTLLSFSDTAIEVVTDPDKLRPVDIPEVRGDYSRLQQDTGWQPDITFEQSLRDLLDDCRQRVRALS